MFSISVSLSLQSLFTKSAIRGTGKDAILLYLYTRKDEGLGHAWTCLTLYKSIPCFPNMWRYNFWAWSGDPHTSAGWHGRQNSSHMFRAVWAVATFAQIKGFFRIRTMPMLRIICPIKYINFNSERSKPGMLPSGHGKWAPCNHYFEFLIKSWNGHVFWRRIVIGMNESFQYYRLAKGKMAYLTKCVTVWKYRNPR